MNPRDDSKSLRVTVRGIFRETLQQVSIPDVIARRIHCAAGVLHVDGLAYPLQAFRRILIVAIGKAAAPMCRALVPILTPALCPGQALEGIAVGPHASPGPDPRIRSLHGGHPLPDQDSAIAADAILHLLADADSATLVLFLISGGASAIVEKPLDEAIALEETALFNSALVRSGLPITRMNALRKHFSQVKAGRLAVAANGATQLTLLVSDVPGSALDVIGSGPSLPDTSTIAECRAIIAACDPSLDLPPRVLAFFESPDLPETPKPDHPAFRRADWLALVSSDELARSAERLASAAGFITIIDNNCDDWDYQDAARYLVDRLAALQAQHAKVCLISAGEVTVRLGKTHGTGGRNQQFVLECARLIADQQLAITVLSGGSDGIDGNSPVAGAVCDQTTAARAASAGFSVATALETFNSFPLFAALGDAIHTGPTGNNLRDLRLLIADAAQPSSE